MDDKILKICLSPSEIFWGDKERNLENLQSVIKNVHPATDVLILPETFSTGFPSNLSQSEFEMIAETNDGHTISLIKNLSDKYNMAITGSFIAIDKNKLYNRAFFIEPSGETYFADKRHLFSLGGEDKRLSPGNERMKVRFRGWNISMIVCYDIRFPVWCRNLGNEYDLLIAVANWPASRVETWNDLLKARAIENEAYVCGVNCRGIDNVGSEYDGSSHVFDFRGRDISVNINEDGLIYGSLSKQKLESYREKFPFWKDCDKFSIIQ